MTKLVGSISDRNEGAAIASLMRGISQRISGQEQKLVIMVIDGSIDQANVDNRVCRCDEESRKITNFRRSLTK